MSMRDTIEYQRQKLEKLEDYITDLNKRHEVAMKALNDLAVGFGRERQTAKGVDWKPAHLAADKLVEIGNMKLRKV